MLTHEAIKLIVTVASWPIGYYLGQGLMKIYLTHK